MCAHLCSIATCINLHLIFFHSCDDNFILSIIIIIIFKYRYAELKKYLVSSELRNLLKLLFIASKFIVEYKFNLSLFNGSNFRIFSLREFLLTKRRTLSCSWLQLQLNQFQGKDYQER
jgi:hypothetical protein